MTVETCAGCSTQYAVGLNACPHCGSAEREAGGAGSGRLPLFIAVSCLPCDRQWNLRLNQVQSGLIEIPALFCTSCGGRVQVTWPPVEDSMPKITVHGGASNARDVDPSPAASASTPPAVAEGGRGPFAVTETVPELDEVQDETPEELAPDYDTMTLAELRAVAEKRGVPSYGSKAQIAERLREAEEA